MIFVYKCPLSQTKYREKSAEEDCKQFWYPRMNQSEDDCIIRINAKSVGLLENYQ